MHTNRIACLAVLVAAVLLAACSAGPTPTTAPLATQPLEQLAPGADIQISLTPTSRPATASPTDTARPSSTPRPPSETPVPPSDTAEPSNTPAPSASHTQPPPSATNTQPPPTPTDTLPPPSPTWTPEAPPPLPPPLPNCDPSYPDFCIPPPPPDLDCPDVAPHKRFTVLQPDPHRFDADKDGIGCES